MTFEITPFRAHYPFQSHYLDRNGLRLHYVHEGQGEPVVMVHGNPTWSFYFRRLALSLRDTHQVVVPDHIGCGLSDKPGDDRYDFRLVNRIDDLEALLDHLKIRGNITLVLHDWGGAIGMGFATRHPERVKRIILFNTGAFFLPEAKGFPWPLYFFRNMPGGESCVRYLNGFSAIASYVAVRRPLPEDIRRGFVAPYDTPAHRLATIRFVQDIPLDPADFSYGEVLRIQSNLYKFQKTPVLMCWGLKDFVFDRHFLRKWKEYLPQAEIHAWRDAGHYVLEDAWDRIEPLVHSFLNRHPIG